MATLFIREGLLPFYLNAKVTFIPNVIYDIMFYALDRGPICISAKTSLRERYKQADLEAIVLKNVHRRALCFLITLEEEEAKSIKRKIDAHEVIGIDEVIVATEPQFDSFIFRLKGMTLIEPQPFEVIQSNQLISKDKIEKK